MKYRVVEVPHLNHVSICAQLKTWHGWVTFKKFNTNYDDKDKYEYCVSKMNLIVEHLNQEIK